MNTAVRDGAIVKNLCQIAGASSDRAKERPVASPVEVDALPPHVLPVLVEQTATWAAPDRVFVGRDGGRIGPADRQVRP